MFRKQKHCKSMQKNEKQGSNIGCLCGQPGEISVDGDLCETQIPGVSEFERSECEDPTPCGVFHSRM